MYKTLIESYRQQAMNMFNIARTKNPLYNSVSEPVLKNMPEDIHENSDKKEETNGTGGTGYVIVNVTTLRSLYPVHGADVTVFTGTLESMNIIDTSKTDENGKSKIFELDVPSESYSQAPEDVVVPYGTYNILVTAEKYVPYVLMNVSVFDKVTSLQNANLLEDFAADGNTDPIINDEKQQYSL